MLNIAPSNRPAHNHGEALHRTSELSPKHVYLLTYTPVSTQHAHVQPSAISNIKPTRTTTRSRDLVRRKTPPVATWNSRSWDRSSRVIRREPISRHDELGHLSEPVLPITSTSTAFVVVTSLGQSQRRMLRHCGGLHLA
jgi:hypothetical protein